MKRLQTILDISPDSRVMVGALYTFALCVAGYLIAQWRISELGLILFASMAFVIVIHPQLGFYLFVVSIFLPINFLNRFFFQVPDIFRWLPHMLLLAAMIIFVYKTKLLSLFC